MDPRSNPRASRPGASRRAWLRGAVAGGLPALAAGLMPDAIRAAETAAARAGHVAPGALGATPVIHAYDGWLLSDGQPATRIARAVWRWEPDGEAYRLAMEIDSALIRLTYESVGRLEPDGLRPLRYRESRKLPMRAARERVLRFDEAGPSAAGGEGGDPLVLPPGGQDRLSVVMQLALLARARPARFSPGSEWVLPLASWRSVDDARFAVGPHETVDAGGRSLSAQRIRRVAAEADQAGIELWLADDAARTPVVIRFDDDGRALRFTLA